jgi:RNA polymerase sigma-70 factor (ECF subfamily)
MTDGDLVRQALAGETAAYERLVHRWSARVLALCHAKVRRAAVAEELAQETLLRGLRALPTLSEPERFGPWLRGIAQRVCLDWLKRRDTRQVDFATLAVDGEPDELFAEPRAGPDAQLQQADEVRRLMDEVAALPDDCREVLLLYYYQDATYRELSDQLGVSFATVNARLTKARNLLRERLGAAPAARRQASRSSEAAVRRLDS